MKNKKWLDNAFWSDNSGGDEITAILSFEADGGRTTTQVMKIPRHLQGSSEMNPDFAEVCVAVSVGKIDANTKERHDKKRREHEDHVEKQREQAKSRELEALFEKKLKAFEIPEVKGSKNRVLKSRLRKSKSTIEMQAYVTMIIMEEVNKPDEPETD